MASRMLCCFPIRSSKPAVTNRITKDPTIEELVLDPNKQSVATGAIIKRRFLRRSVIKKVSFYSNGLLIINNFNSTKKPKYYNLSNILEVKNSSDNHAGFCLKVTTPITTLQLEFTTISGYRIWRSLLKERCVSNKSSYREFKMGDFSDQLSPAVDTAKPIIETNEEDKEMILVDGVNKPANVTSLKTGKFVQMLTQLQRGSHAEVFAGYIDSKRVILKKYSRSYPEVFKFLSEYNILQENKSPFVIGLLETIKTPLSFILVMKYIPGGNLFSIAKRSLNPFSFFETQFVAAEIVLGLTYLHENRIIHGDIKLENVVLDMNGHAVIIDFGSAIRTVCGPVSCKLNSSPKYMAPEIIVGNRFYYAVDWWCFGVIMYTLTVKSYPFEGETAEETFKSVLLEKEWYPEGFSRTTKNFISQLLTKLQYERLGYWNSAKVKDHPYFWGINWGHMLNKQKISPLCHRCVNEYSKIEKNPQFEKVYAFQSSFTI